MPSTSILRHAYDPATRVMSVWFVSSGRRYDYDGVPQDEYEAFTRAFSKGTWFNRFIRDKYPGRWAPFAEFDGDAD
ncbi:KTSC domain-containing protein [Salmonella enterica subsp. enterica]|nr:KTSC domain-containing protein [Salmonella enterica subsp. enterica]